MIKGRQLLQLVVPALALTTLTACAVRSDPALTLPTANPVSFTAVSMVLEDDPPASRAAFLTALEAQLQSHGVRVDEGAPYVGDFAFSSSAADAPIYTSEAGQTPDEPELVVRIRESKWTDACKATRTRATLALFRVSDGVLMSRSSAEALVCVGDEPPFTGLAEALVADVLSR